MSASKDAPTTGRAAAPRKRDAERTKRRILTAAAQHFARSGYSGASLQDIVTEAGVTPAMVIHHFGSKMGLFSAVASEKWGLDEETGAVPSLTAEELAHNLVVFWSDRNARLSSLALARSLDIPDGVELFRFVLERRLGRLWRENLGGADVEERIRLLMGLGMGFGFFSTGALLDPDAPPLGEEEAATMERYLARMIAVLLDA